MCWDISPKCTNAPNDEGARAQCQRIVKVLVVLNESRDQECVQQISWQPMQCLLRNISWTKMADQPTTRATKCYYHQQLRVFQLQLATSGEGKKDCCWISSEFTISIQINPIRNIFSEGVLPLRAAGFASKLQGGSERKKHYQLVSNGVSAWVLFTQTHIPAPHGTQFTFLSA